MMSIVSSPFAGQQILPDGALAVSAPAATIDDDADFIRNGQRALLNILEDFAAERSGLEHLQRAMLNILDDFETEKGQFASVQRSMLNILEDTSDERTRLEDTQRAALNILDDFETEKRNVELANQQLEKEIEERKRVETRIYAVNTELLSANKELEAFSYSVSHDLRSPLRGIDGLSMALLEDYADKLDERGRGYLHRVRNATQRMGTLIDDLLNLSRMARTVMKLEKTDLAAIASSVAADLQKSQPERRAEFRIASGLEALVDSHLITIALENLLGNAWKFIRSVVPPALTSAQPIATAPSPTTSGTMALGSTRPMPIVSSPPSNVFTIKAIFLEQASAWRRSKGLFSVTAVAFGRRVPSNKAQHFTLRCRTWLLRGLTNAE